MYWLRKYFSNRREHGAALLEVAVTTIVSLLPLFCAPQFDILKHSESRLPTFMEIFGRGQLFILTYGVFGTVFWLSFFKSSRAGGDIKKYLGFAAFIINIPIIVLLSEDPSLSTISQPFYIQISYWLFGLMALIYYLLLFYAHIPPPETDQIFSRESNEMRGRYEELKSGS